MTGVLAVVSTTATEDAGYFGRAVCLRYFCKSQSQLLSSCEGNQHFLLKHKKIGQVQGLMPIIPALREAKAGGSRGQEFKTSLANADLGKSLRSQRLHLQNAVKALVALASMYNQQMFKISLANMAKPRLYKKNPKISWAGSAPVILATQGAEAGESLEPG
ncbi:hypothetical protein AAY473_036940, partial [Plecturocebus cupreus]